jgi:hypothetical protein
VTDHGFASEADLAKVDLTATQTVAVEGIDEPKDKTKLRCTMCRRVLAGYLRADFLGRWPARRPARAPPRRR